MFRTVYRKLHYESGSEDKKLQIIVNALVIKIIQEQSNAWQFNIVLFWGFNKHFKHGLHMTPGFLV